MSKNHFNRPTSSKGLKRDKTHNYHQPPQHIPVPQGARHIQIGKGIWVLTSSVAKAKETKKRIDSNR